MNLKLIVLFLAILVSPAYVQHCERRQRIHLDSYQGTNVVFPQQFPVQKGYAGNLTCVWEILTENKFRIMVYPRIWTCSDMTLLNLFYGLSEMAEIDDCVICPSEKGFCPNIIQTKSSDAVLELFTYSNDAQGGFDFRFMAVNATALVDGCSSTGIIMKANRTPNYIASPNFPEAYPSEMNCLWLIEPVVQDNNTRLVFQFQSQSLEKGVITACTDYVTIEGLGEFCETDRDTIFQPSEKMYTKNTATKVTFVTDFAFSESGFVLSFYVEDTPKPCLCQHGGTCMNETCLCSMGYKGEYCEKDSVEILFLNVSNQVIREENPVWFIAETYDVYKYEIQWFRNGIMVTDAATRYKMTSFTTTNGTRINTLNISRAYNHDEGNWTIRASNGVTSVERNLVFKVLPRLRLEMLPQYDFSIRSGDILNLKCSVLNPESLSSLSNGSLVWLKDSQDNLEAAGYQISNTNTTSTLQSTSTIPANSGIYTCYYSSYPDPVRVSVRVNVTETEQKICPYQTANGILWSSTIAGATSKTACSRDQIGTATRSCDSEGKWKNSNLVNCTDKVFHEASQKLIALREDGVNNTEEVEKVVNIALQTMKNLTSTTAELSAGDIQSSLDIIEAVVDAMSLSGATIEKKVFFEVVDNVLSKNNSDSWSAVSTETTKDASVILKNMDRLSEQVLKKNDTKFNFSGANFELSINQVKVEEEGIMFPTKNDNSNLTENPATFLELPKQNSKTNTEINYVAVIYKTMSEILPTNTNLKRENINTLTEVKKTSKEYVNSDILSLTTQIDLVELNPPLNLTFYHKKKNQSKELQPVCVSWNFTTKKWSEEGCEMFSTSGKRTSCLCNHLTNFAILMRPYIAKLCLRVCQHGGTCMNETCLCSWGYKGEYCENESIEIILLNVSNQIIREENPVWFIAETNDVYKYEIQWFRNGIMVTDAATRYRMTSSATTHGTTINTLNIYRAKNRDEGNWRIRASNGVTSAERNLTIKVLPRLRLEILPQYDFSIRSGDILNLKCSVLNPESLASLSNGSLVWLKENQDNLKVAGYQISNTNTTTTLQSTSAIPGNSGMYTCYYSSYPDPVRVFIRVNVTEKEQKMCPYNTTEGISWSSTIAGTTSKTACSEDQIGTATRLCDSEGKWKNPNLVNCTDKVFNEASQKLTALREDGVNNTEEVEKAVNSTLQTMKNLTSTTAEMSAGDIQSSLDIIEAVVDVTSLSGATVEKKVFFEVVDNVLSKNNSDSWSAVNSETTKDASIILKNMDKLSEQVLKKNDTKFKFSGANFELSINQVKVEEEGIKFPTKNDNSNLTENPATFLELPKQTSKTNTEMNYVAVIYKTISDILPTDTNLKRENLNTRTEVIKTVKEYVNSDILSLTTQRDLGELNPPLNLTFYHKKQNQSEELQPVCVSWNFTTKKWSEKGCQMFSTSGKSTSCLCNHLTNFAILMRPYIPETEDESSLKTLSFIGVVLSIAFIVLTFTIFIVTWKQMKNDQNTMLLNLCVSLVLSYIVFITAVEKTDNEIICSAVTAIIHYLFLVTFFNMLGMGVYYFISITVTYYAMYVANNFKSRSRVHWFLLGAWGIPLVISASTLGGFWKKGYHLKHYCWLSVESGSLFLFIVPVCCTIVLNLVVIISLIRVLLASSVMMKSSLKKKAASGLRSLGTLLPVLGVTWLFGILAVNKNADFFQYLFIIANSLQVSVY